MGTSSVTKVVAIFFILAAAILGSLAVFNAISAEVLKESLLKLFYVVVIVVVASWLIVIVSGNKSDK